MAHDFIFSDFILTRTNISGFYEAGGYLALPTQPVSEMRGGMLRPSGASRRTQRGKISVSYEGISTVNFNFNAKHKLI